MILSDLDTLETYALREELHSTLSAVLEPQFKLNRERAGLMEIKGSIWESWYIPGTPFGIEKIDSNAYFNFRFFDNNKRRVYLDREASYSSISKAMNALGAHVARYNDSIVVAVTA